MNKISRFGAALLLAAAFVNCGDNGVGSDDTASLKLMSQPGGAGVEIDITELEPGTEHIMYLVAFDDATDAFVEDVDFDGTPYVSPSIGTVRDTTIGGSILGGGDKAIVLSVNDVIPMPSGLASVTGSGVISLSWSAPESATVVSYTVYRDTVDSDSMELATSTAASYTDVSVTNGIKYYYAVSAVISGDLAVTPALEGYAAKTFTVQAVSMPTSTVDDAACSQWIEVQVYVRAGTGYSMLDLSDATTYSLNGTDGTLPDVWLNNDFVFWGCENNGGNLTGAWDNTTKIYSFGPADFDDAIVSEAPDLTDSGWGDSAAAVAGNVYAMYTEDGFYAKVRVDEVNDDDGSADDYVLLTLGYQSINGYTNFKTAAK